MGRSRSFKLTKEWVPPATEDFSSSSPFASSSSSFSFSPPHFWPSSVFWLLGLAIASLSGYELSQAPLSSVKSMWIDQLFSEYIPPGSEHLHLIHERDHFLTENNTEPPELWDPPKSYGWKPCLDPQEKITTLKVQKGYLQVFCTGGLFQLHICVCNAVAVAWLLNASLVIPYFQESVVWKDPRCGLLQHINMLF